MYNYKLALNKHLQNVVVFHVKVNKKKFQITGQRKATPFLLVIREPDLLSWNRK